MTLVNMMLICLFALYASSLWLEDDFIFTLLRISTRAFSNMYSVVLHKALHTLLLKPQRYISHGFKVQEVTKTNFSLGNIHNSFSNFYNSFLFEPNISFLYL